MFKNNSLALKIMEELNEFKNRDPDRASLMIDDNLKMVGFNLVKRHGQQPIKLIVNAYNLKESPHLFVDKIRELIKQHLYKDVRGRPAYKFQFI